MLSRPVKRPISAGFGASPAGPRRVRRIVYGACAVACASVAASVAVALLLAHAACEPARRGPALAGRPDLPVILYACDNQGVLAACGCPSNPSGGFAKRVGLVEAYRRTRPHVLVVDSGDFFPDYDHDVKVRHLAEGLARAKIDALGMGDQEFALGRDWVRRLRSEYGLPLICANVRDAATGEPVVPGHVIVERAGLKFGIFSVIEDAAYGWPVREWRVGLKVEDPVEAARREVAALAGCDVVVALSHRPLYATRAMAEAVPGIDLVISGPEHEIIAGGEKAGGALLVAAGEAGRAMGAVVVERTEGGLRFDAEVTELTAQVPESQWATDLYWAYVKESKDKPPPDWDHTPIPKRYDTAEACRKCHPAEYRQWAATKHAHAYDSIRKAGRHEDPECLLCHTMGLGREGGFVSMKETPALGRVTCQGCHVVAADHADRKIKPEPKINISSRLCMSCHGPVQSPKFDYFTYKPKILHHPPGTESTKVKATP